MLKFINNIGGFNNKLNCIKLNNNVLCYFSYDSLIAIEYNSFIIFDSYYINFSNTTNKHIHYLKDYNDYYNIILDSKVFDYINEYNFNIDHIESIINKHKNLYYCNEYIKEFKDNIKYKIIDINNFNDSYLHLKHHIELLNNNLKIIKDSYKSLKTVDQLILNYKCNNISFDIIKTFNKKNKKLSNIRLINYKIEPLY